MVIDLSENGAVKERGFVLDTAEEKLLHDFITDLPKFNSVMTEFKKLVDEGQLEALSHVLAAVRGMREGLNDEAVESVSRTASRLLELASALSSDDTLRLADTLRRDSSELAETIDLLGRMQREGVLENLASAGYVLRAVREGLNDDAIENLFGSLTEVMSFWKQYSSLLTGEEITSVLSKLARIEREGVLDTLLDGAYVLKSFRDGMNDESAANLSELFSEVLAHWRDVQALLNAASSPVLRRMLAVLSSDSLMKQLENAPAKKGGLSLLSPSDPDIRKGLGVIFELLRVIGEEFSRDGDGSGRKKD
ncbi:MAG: DUF1641 domain-containing protein, partial [Candidatus Thermoplasmatota archaeon]|nr:DUF1641 domain-containing protein [Candidatus Thermoplasmatota archaeon]